MAVIFAVVGGGAVVGIATADPYDDYSNYGDYSNYDNYSNYSDAAERRARRRREKEREIEEDSIEVNTYKVNKINEYLKSENLKREPGVSVGLKAVKEDGYKKIDDEKERYFSNKTSDIVEEVKKIDCLLEKINKALEEK